MSEPRVVVVQEHLPHYREAFFEQARAALQERGIVMDLVYGARRDSRFVGADIGWAKAVPMKKIGPFVWHRAWNECRAADLLVCCQENKYLFIHFMQMRSWLGMGRFSYWGHGKNFQASDPDCFAERVKRFLARRVDWWFAYNELSREVVRDLGFPPEKITTVGNAIDTAALVRMKEEMRPSASQRVRDELGLRGENIAVYTGGLSAIKRIAFLIEVARLIRKKIPDFELIVIGDGPEKPRVLEAAGEEPWLHYVGPKGDAEKVPYWSLAKLLLMPGGVGLVVLDSFALGVPMVTTDTTLHGPEIAYLESGGNGVLVKCGEDTDAYATEVAELFKDPDRLRIMSGKARASASDHTIEAMVANFCEGVCSALEDSKSHA